MVTARTANRVLMLILIVGLVGVNGAQIALGIQFFEDAPVVEGNDTQKRTIVASDPPTTSVDAELVLYEGSERVAVWDKYDAYFDVDPVGNNTVEYTAVKRGGLPYCEDCAKNYLIRHNIETNETTVLRTSVEPSIFNKEWHDVDRLDNGSYVFADMSEDEVYVYNTSRGVQTWGWELYPRRGPETGYGITSGDWSHMNDVESVRGGDQYMVSLRNHNEIVFVDADNGTIVDSIGGNGTQVMFEQHNPDYIPKQNGGPAVVIADSQNDRIVEYEKRNGSWEKTWEWRDKYMNWPRDADRLPNGNTLVSDTYSDRVAEVNENGTVVWSVEATAPYDAERLGTGDESEGGPAASKVGLESQVVKQSHSQYSEFFGDRNAAFITWALPWLDWWDFIPFVFLLATFYLEGFYLFNQYLYEPYIESILDEYL